MSVIDLHHERHRRHEAKASRDEVMRDIERLIDYLAEVYAERAFVSIRMVMNGDPEAEKILGCGFARQCRARIKSIVKSFKLHPDTVTSAVERASQSYCQHLGMLHEQAKAGQAEATS